MLFRKHNFDVKDAAYMFNQQNVCKRQNYSGWKDLWTLESPGIFKTKTVVTLQKSICTKPYIHDIIIYIIIYNPYIHNHWPVRYCDKIVQRVVQVLSNWLVNNQHLCMVLNHAGEILGFYGLWYSMQIKKMGSISKLV